MSTVAPIISIDALVKHFPTGRSLFGRRRFVKAVNGVDLHVSPGETLALVGESGCGKTTTARVVLGLEQPTGGGLRYHGTPVESLDPEARARFRRRVQVVFQDSNASLNPRKTLREILTTALVVSGTIRSGERARLRERVAKLLDDVGLSPASSFLDRLPHELSGGQRQRVGIARALAPEPELVIADEPVSALDISVRAQVLELMARIQRERGVAFLLISHDLAVVRHVAARVAVMYLGRIIEEGPVDAVFGNPVHPYTAALVDATPLPDPRPEVRGRGHLDISGDVPSPIDLPSGCAFHPRCPIAVAHCRTAVPLLEAPSAGRADPAADVAAHPGAHRVACHRADERVAGLALPITMPAGATPASQAPPTKESPA